MARRLIIEMVGGTLAVRDRDRPQAATVSVALADGRTVAVARHLCGWLPDADSQPLWPDAAAAAAALSDEGDGWSAVLAAGAALAPPPTGDLGIRMTGRIAALAAANPGAWIDGPHPRPDGSWYMTLTGPGVLEATIGEGASPDEAAAALARNAARAAERP